MGMKPKSASVDRLGKGLLQGARYAAVRARERARIIEHKRPRRVAISPCIDLVFESRDTVRFQLQEILFVESIRDPQRVRATMAEHARLVPTPGALVATIMVCAQCAEDAQALDRALQVGGLELRLGRRHARATVLDEDAVSPVRYVAFDDFRPTPVSSPTADLLSLRIGQHAHDVRLPLTLAGALDTESRRAPWSRRSLGTTSVQHHETG